MLSIKAAINLYQALILLVLNLAVKYGV